MDQKKSIEQANKLSDMVNGSIDFEEVADLLANKTHRYLQQELFKFFLTYVRKQAEKDDHNFDGRNEYTVKLSKKLNEVVKEFYL